MNEEANGILKAAWLIALVTIASKFMGFVRDMVVANFYGATMVSDAYFYALQIPSLAIIILGGVGGPFHSAVVAVFSKLLGNDCTVDEKINKLYNTFLTLTFLFFAVLAIAGFFFADKIMGIIISSGSPELLNLASEHFRIMSPIILIGGIIGIYYGLLVCHKKYILPNLSPMMLSLVVIISVIIAGGDDKFGIVLAFATLVGAIMQIVIQLPAVRKIGYRLKPNLDLVNNIQLKNLTELLFPAILSSTIGQIGIYIDMFFASTLQEGAWTSVVFANRIFQFPVGILVTAFLVPLFPLFSRLAGEGKDKYQEIRNYFNKGVGVLFFAAIPIIILILLVSKDAVSLIFERGEFNSNAVLMVTEALCFLSFSILPYVFRDSITRVYYAFNDSKTPFIIALWAIALKALLNWLLILKLNMGIAGITLSTSLVTLFNATILGLLIHRKIRLDYKKLFINFGKMILSGVLTFFICLFACKYFNALTFEKYIFETVKILGIMIICFGIYLGLNILFKMEYAGELLKRIYKKNK